MKSRILASVAPATALALLLAAPGAQAADDRLAKIEASGELRVCHAEDNPWTYRDPATGEWLGFTRDLAADLAADASTMANFAAKPDVYELASKLTSVGGAIDAGDWALAGRHWQEFKAHQTDIDERMY